ncbi:MAG: NAD(P)/FAD-dependent oxidoreductase [Gemmatimonadota bacterium]
MSETRVIVIGGGVIGISAAYELAVRGARVTVLERDELGAGASFGNAGTVSPGHPPINKPGRVRRALRQMLDPTSPLYIHPSWNPELWRWLWTFSRHCSGEHVERVMRVLAPLGHEALARFDALVEEEALECGYRRDGYFDVCLSDAGLEEARHEARMIEPYGYHPETLDEAGMHAAIPQLGGVVGGVYFPEAATMDPYRFLVELAARARSRSVDVREGEEVVDLTPTHGGVSVRTASGGVHAGDAALLATGPFSLRLARKLGVRLPVQPGKGYHRDVDMAPDGAPLLEHACVLHETSVFCTPMGGFVRFAGTMEFSGPNLTLRRARLEQLTRAARHYFPDLGTRPPRSEWCGLRPVSADGLPVVGPLPAAENVVVATGHGMLGLTLAPATGRLVADWILEGGPDPLYRALAPERFVN